jgi:hypothetical protein
MFTIRRLQPPMQAASGPCPRLTPSPVMQALKRARADAPDGTMLTRDVADSIYGDRFWARVAAAVPGRTAAECLDAYIVSHCSPVARFVVRDSLSRPSGRAEPPTH